MELARHILLFRNSFHSGKLPRHNAGTILELRVQFGYCLLPLAGIQDFPAFAEVAPEYS